jgi:glycosyltransferase involved in cell wall biosynthesis
MSQLRIAYICPDPGIPLSGMKGSSVHVSEMVAAFEALGHEVVLLCANTGDPRPSVLEPGSFMERRHAADSGVRSWITDKRNSRRISELERLALNRKLSQSLLDQSREKPFDLIYERYSLFQLAGLLTARVRSIPHLLEVNAPLCYEEVNTRSGIEFWRLARHIEQTLLKNTDHVLTVSEVLRSFAVEEGTRPSRVTVVPNGVTPKRFDSRENARHEFRRQLRLQNKIVIGFVGSLKLWHGTTILIDAFSKLAFRDSRLHLLLVGDGPKRVALEDRIKVMGLTQRVTLTGSIAHDLVPGHIASMDIAVAPYAKSEFFYFSPVKTFEYLAAGTATVAARLGQLCTTIKDGETGILVEPGDVAALEEALRRLISDSCLRERIGRAGREWVMRERTWESNAKLAAGIGIATAAELHRRSIRK